MLNPKLETLQHERGFSKQQNWLQYWQTLSGNEAKGRFLIMLKERRDNGDMDANDVFMNLVDKWVSENSTLTTP